MNHKTQQKSSMAPFFGVLAGFALVGCVYQSNLAIDAQEANEKNRAAYVDVMLENKELHENMMRLYEDSLVYKDEANNMAVLLEQYQSQESTLD